MDGRRHSVDIPISRTLVALRRVRSLRDPSTNSLSKFTSLLETANWETNSTNDVSLRSMNSCKEGGSEHNSISGWQNLGLRGQKEEQVDDFDLHCDLVKSKSKLKSGNNLVGADDVSASIRTKKVDELQDSGSNQEEARGNKTLSARYCSNREDKGLDLVCITPLSDRLEDGDSTSEPILASPQAESISQSVSKRRSQYKYHVKSFGVAGDVSSCVGSPSLSANDALSSHSTSFYANDEATFVVQDDQGCGISCCWTRNPRFRESNPYSGVDGRPLLSRDVAESTPQGRGNWKHITDETPRGLSHKFRPKSFDELVGQNVVSRSLLGAVSSGRINSLYIFHGPRGTGKTSASRIFAAALNCLSFDEHKPCGLCRECVLFFSGRSRDVKEVDPLRINRAERIRFLMKDVAAPPASSRFKVFIVEECHLLHGDAWATVLNYLENLYQHVVFVMITPELDKLPRGAVTRSQRYYFPKIKDAEIASRLENICVEEGLDFDHAALDFIASKSNGSLRDGEMMLEQLSLLGKRITMCLAYELIGVVSDDELLDLLDLALSADTSNTVIRARELMRSRIDPMQLVSQLANLIMDILAGKGGEDSSEVRRKFSRRRGSEVDMQRLSHALKVLSETEKHLRMSKNQSTWLTVALLQLSSLDSSSLDANDSKTSLRNEHERDCDFCSTSSTGESLKHLVTCSCEGSTFQRLGMQADCQPTLESIWIRATELCRSNSLKSFLRKEGKLASLCVQQGLAVAELEFQHPGYVAKAERSWKMIASSLQAILGCNVEIRINLVMCAPVSKCAKLRKLSFRMFSCSRRMQQKSQSPMECGSDSDYSDKVSQKPMITDKAILTCSSDCGSQMPHSCYRKAAGGQALRSSEGNVLSLTTSSRRSLQDDTLKTPGYEVFSPTEFEGQPNCFPKSLRLHKKFQSSENSHLSGLVDQHGNNPKSPLPRKKGFETCMDGYDSYVFSSNGCANNSVTEDQSGENSIAFCWRTPTDPLNKACQLTQQRHRSPLVGWVLPCASAK